MKNMRIGTATLAVGLLLAGSAMAEDVVRHKIPNSDFPIARAVEVPAGKTTVYLSGATPSVIDEKAEKNSIASFGNTKAQTESVLKSIEQNLESLGLKMGDVVKMQVFLIGDPEKDGKMDFAGFMEGYTQFFGTEAQPNLPTRSVFQVAGLANPGWLVEIEVTAVRP
ncbi:enamine deaminase RidA (YjgF/YER057c/UK114 family) [Pseudaminobacter salicylatoxidans]|uniref:Enamine deaminase RidA (YjgF/YER057c/UK114 family) n=1 Tax=Pseudaminobacter salicylatoxidans TaxID=93369 RepID=A0A316BU47_PSESE|nr:RidA family protein [Pseudaminobacter salicylatoxidans]PWJ77596.1 enamine deaminase RidA (YjgF/YER057c/UK114 family) [Pseudaminobacter salicylatoxidans]